MFSTKQREFLDNANRRWNVKRVNYPLGFS